ncbi:MAG TPA: DinB family protein [Longimicrobiales bacterium]|nr:DinB family protein [Longimicrobiales bacterium]
MSTQDARREIVAELEAARLEFHAMLASVSAEDWTRPSANPAWTNGQLLAHVTFGYLLVPRLWRVLQAFSKLPRSWSRAFAALLSTSTPLYNRINALVPRLGTRLYGAAGLERRYDRIHERVLELSLSLSEADWERGMHYPTRWDPRFADFMKFEDVLRWSVAHLRHHETQLRPSPRNR